MCGILGIYNTDKKEILNEIFEIMTKLQHRGKESYGISLKEYNGKLKHLHKIGKINNFNINEENTIVSCIGHLKYRTSNMLNKNITNIQPIINNNISISHNGNIPNIVGFDTQHILDLIVNFNGTFENSLINLIKTVPAAYSLIVQYNDTIYILKDRYGIRPLSYGFKDNNVYISSETIAIKDCRGIKELESGQIIEINEKGIREIYKYHKTNDNICAFEFIYFMNSNSFYKNIPIKLIRENLACKLVEKEKLKFSKEYIVVGVPNSGIVYGEKYSKLLSLNYEQIIQSNTKERTFISPNIQDIQNSCHKKFKYDKQKINGSKIIVLDDTIVRGNVMKYICSSLREYGAKEIHIRIPSPPVIDICQLGIAINSKEELIMIDKNKEEVCSTLNVESLEFLEMSDLDIIPFDTYKECFGGGIEKDIIEYM